MEDWIKEKLIEEIGAKRFSHSIGVMETAVELAELYRVDKNKAMLAGLLHDCAKIIDPIYLLKRANDFDIILDDIMKKNNELIHGPLGSRIAEYEYMIKDREILDAIYYHTTGREKMSMLDKIIYIADFIEPSRNYPGVDAIRELAFKDLDKSILLSMENTLIYLISQRRVIHLDTIRARNYMLSIEKSEANV